jgi:SAM-dependent methyltransferase
MATVDWSGEGGARWADVADRLEAQLAPVDDVLFAAAKLVPGEHVLDVGCGRGATTRHAAALVGSSGSATGIDVAAVLIEEAERTAAAEERVTWLLADAQRAALPEASFDVVISRFGTIFFDDAIEAFANLLRATKPGGRLAIAVWQRRDLSPVLHHTLEIAIATARELGTELNPPDPAGGPNAYGNPAHMQAVLTAAGWHDVTFTPYELDMYLGGPASPEEATAANLRFGQLATLLADAPPDLVDAIRTAIVDDLRTRHDGVGVKLGAAIAVVTATRRS